MGDKLGQNRKRSNAIGMANGTYVSSQSILYTFNSKELETVILPSYTNFLTIMLDLLKY